MSVRASVIAFAATLFVSLSPTGFSSPTANRQPSFQGKGDLIAYHTAGLPDPVVIYAYDAKGTLLRIFGEDGDNGRDGMKKMSDIISSGNIPAIADADPSADIKFRHFVMSQGLRPERLIAHDSKYTLILIVPDTAGQPCPPCENYNSMLSDAITRPASANLYSWITLKLGAPNVQFQIAK